MKPTGPENTLNNKHQKPDFKKMIDYAPENTQQKTPKTKTKLGNFY